VYRVKSWRSHPCLFMVLCASCERCAFHNNPLHFISNKINGKWKVFIFFFIFLFFDMKRKVFNGVDDFILFKSYAINYLM
jgi:hypothetical protein